MLVLVLIIHYLAGASAIQGVQLVVQAFLVSPPLMVQWRFDDTAVGLWSKQLSGLLRATNIKLPVSHPALNVPDL